MQLCYFLMVHHKPEQFARLLAAIHDPQDSYILHIDARTPEPVRARFLEIIEPHENVELLPSQRMVWGHWSLAEAHRRALALAMDMPGWEYFINLSGACYPLKQKEEIRRQLATQPGANYVGMQPLERCPWHVRLRFRLYWVLLGGRVRPLPAWRMPPRNVDYRWKGANWAILHRSFCQWIDADPLAERICRFLRHAKLPEEFWLQWALMSGPFRDTRQPYRHHIRWIEGQPHPHLFTAADIEELRASDALFARKFDIDHDAGIFDLLDAHRN